MDLIKADLYIKDYSLNIEKSKAIIQYKDELFELETPLIGKFNLYNLSAAVLCTFELGICKK